MEYDSEVEMDGEEGEAEDMSEEESEGEALPVSEGAKPVIKKGKRDKTASRFASYEEFAHLLDEDSDDDKKKSKDHFSSDAIGKRTY
jgi:hypothetical protein